MSSPEPSNLSDASEGEQWRWLYSDDVPTNDERPRSTPRPLRKGRQASRTIIGACAGSESYYRGDCVLLRAEGSNQCWVAIIQSFTTDEDGMKAAEFVWFSNEKEVMNKAKKRTDALPNEIYISTSADVNSLDTIDGKARVVSLDRFLALHPTAKIPRRSEDAGKLFVCRRGLDMRTTAYTDEFTWEDRYSGFDDLAPLIEFVTSSTSTARRKTSASAKARSKVDTSFTGNQKQDTRAPTTPRKRRAIQDPGSTRFGSLSQAHFPSDANYAITAPRTPDKGALEFTPLSMRHILLDDPQVSPFQLARNRLHVASVPTNLPCREKEFDEVYFQLEKAISNGASNCIYISGTPGAGKTATVREVIRQLERDVEANQLDDFIFVEINGMKITNPHHSYALLWEALKGDRVSAAQALELLEREFTNPNPRRVPCVVLMDELDQLVTKNQSVMYNFFNWPALRHSRLIVLAVANTMDLPERTLSNKISSRLGLTRIAFPGYNHEQLVRIIQSRLEGVPGDIVDPDAIRFASMKIASVSGDARRALDICRRAIELVENDGGARSESQGAERNPRGQKSPGKGRDGLPRVTISTIKQAIAEAISNPVQQHLRSLAFLPKLFLASVLSRMGRSGGTDSTLADVIEEMTKILKACAGRMGQDVIDSLASLSGDCRVEGTTGKRGIPTPRSMGLGVAALELENAGIIILEEHTPQRPRKIQLAISETHVRMAFRDDPEIHALGIQGI
ncbi:related to origin recognition protein Orc1p [Cephalotrichum gorgonifer]|uniref:Origin recognition complex subunit 1 n=1 Tax=Cephalotrichum gorgonifer TaxID=2041049 RepID=A0AAE8SS80_9PEZI|nr:related to origin recognition protein Orc1p [Cephalotrichum gorgonifer]